MCIEVVIAAVWQLNVACFKAVVKALCDSTLIRYDAIIWFVF